METTEIEKVEQQTSEIQNQAAMKIPFAQLSDIASKSALEKVFNADRLDFNTNAETWSPEDKGDRKRLVFQGIKEKAKTKNIFRQEEGDPEYVYLDKAAFVEIYKDGDTIKQRMIESYATSLVSYMIENNVPRHAIMDVEFMGEKKANSGFKFHTFSINLVPLEF
ncbi:hypothetical protein [Ekhidna sp.]